MNRCWKLASLAAGLVAGLTGCSDDSSDAERRVVLRGLADEVVLPALDEAAARSAAMATAIDAVVAAPDQATLDAAQAAWRTARVPWKETAAFGFGPAADQRLGVAIDQSPVDFTKIDAEIAAATPISDAYIDGLGANRKGFHALEYLLFHYDDDAAVLAALTTDAAAARRRELLGALAHNHARRSGELATAWSPSGGGGYITLLVEPGNTTYPTVKASIDAFVNESVYLAELLADLRIGKPLGLATGGVPQPELEESGPSDHSIDDLAASVRSIQHVYLGTRGAAAEPTTRGLSALVAARRPALDGEVIAAIDQALAALAAIPRPYRIAVESNREAVQAAYDAVKELKRILGTEVVAVLGTTLEFNDNDGD